ncbi:hypothetical protein N9L76_09295 [bacterium]|nr:hypothetical protein [bacterium]
MEARLVANEARVAGIAAAVVMAAMVAKFLRDGQRVSGLNTNEPLGDIFREASFCKARDGCSCA